MSVVSRMLDDCPGDAVAILSEDGPILYDELADAVHFLSDRLTAVGITSASVVGLVHGDGVRAVIALAALANIGAAVVTLPVDAHPDDLLRTLTAADAHVVIADVTVEHVLEDLTDGEIPYVVADEYSLLRVHCSPRPGAPVTSRSMFAARGSWAEVFDAAGRVAADGRFDSTSTVTVSETVSSRESSTILCAAWAAGAAVAVHDPICVEAAPWAVASRLHRDEVTVIAGSASYIESLVRTGVVGLLPISSLTDIVVVSGRISDPFRGVLAAAMPAVRVIHSGNAALVCA